MWGASDITSARTARPVVPAIMRKIEKCRGWHFTSRNFDAGAGPYPHFTKELKDISVTNLTWDPHNLSPEHNAAILAEVMAVPATSGTLSNVLNVIKTKKDRKRILEVVRRAVYPGCWVYITVYEGDKSGKGRKTRDGWQENRRLEGYLPEVQSVFTEARLHRGMICAYFCGDPVAVPPRLW